MKALLGVVVAVASVVIAVEGRFFDKIEKTIAKKLNIKDEEVKLRELLTHAEEIDIDGCKCVDYNCGCCARIVVKKVEFDENICVNFSYLPKEYGIRVTITLNDFILLNQSVSAKNPPALCVGVPHVKELSLCLRFYNLSISGPSFSGCVRIEAHILHIIEEEYDLGCFKIGKGQKTTTAHIINRLKQHLEVIEKSHNASVSYRMDRIHKEQNTPPKITYV